MSFNRRNNPTKTEDPGVILSRTMFIDNSDPDNIKILPWHQVEHVRLGILWEMRDIVPESLGGRNTSTELAQFKKVTNITFIDEAKLYNKRFGSDGKSGAGMVGGPGAGGNRAFV